MESIKPRSVWQHEAHDVAPWRMEDTDVLADALGIHLELSAAEHPVGGVNLDLIGRDLTNDCVLIVENQLSATNHGHLGQLLTYAGETEARAVVWLAPQFREEHRQALDYLNDLAGDETRFLGIELAVVRIGGSDPAPLFRVRAQPNDWHAQVAALSKSTSLQAGKAPLYRQLWTRFLERVGQEHPDWTNARKPQTANWFPMACPFRGGPYYAFSFAAGGRLRSELYIDLGEAEANTVLFEALHEQQEAIEELYGAPLSWEDLAGKRACRIADYGDGDVANVDQHDACIDWFFERGQRFQKAIEMAASQLRQD